MLTTDLQNDLAVFVRHLFNLLDLLTVLSLVESDQFARRILFTICEVQRKFTLRQALTLVLLFQNI